MSARWARHTDAGALARVLCLACMLCVTAHAFVGVPPCCAPRQALVRVPWRPVAGAGGGRRGREARRWRMQVNRGLAAQRAALQLAAAQQVELRLKVQKTLEHLQAKRAEAVEKEEWDRVLQMVSDTLTEELETEPSPWELSPDLLEEAELVFSGGSSPYMNIALGDKEGGVDIVGTTTLDLDDGVVQRAFDDAIAAQKEMQPKTFLENLIGYDPLKERLESSYLNWKTDPSIRLPPADTFEARKELIELQIEDDYNFLVQRSATLADKAYAEGRARFSRKGHRVPWEVVQREVLVLQNSLLRLRDPISQQRGIDSAKGAADESVRKALRLPKDSAWAPLNSAEVGKGALGARNGEQGKGDDQGISNLLSSVMSEVVGEDQHNESAIVLSIGSRGVELERLSAPSIMQSQLDWELADFREQVDAIRMSTEELIKDVNRWRQVDKKLPYGSVSEFRAYVLESVGQRDVGEEADAYPGKDVSENSRDIPTGGDGISERGMRVEAAANEGRAEGVMVGPWGALESLLMTREQALTIMMAERGFSLAGPVALNETDLQQENLKWVELDEVAESEWRFFDVGQYDRYQDMREGRIKMLTRRKQRNYEIALASCEAEVSLDEYMGVMLDLGWAEPGIDLEIAQVGRSALSGKGRELGLDPRLEFVLSVLIYVAYATLILYPAAPMLLRQLPADGAGANVMDWSPESVTRSIQWWIDVAHPQGTAAGIDLFRQGPSAQSALDFVWNMMND